jgi:tetratricopeptide (TPR) repeat protein
MPLISDVPDLGDPELVLEDDFDGDGDGDDDFAADLSMDESGARYETGSIAGEAHAEEIIKILTETDVYVKYGLHQKAIDHLKRVFELDPENVEARERLKEIYVSQGRDDEAINELLALAEQAAQADPGQAEGYLQELLAIDGTHQAALDLARRFNLEIGAGPEVEIVEDLSDAIELDPDSLDSGLVAPVDDELDFADMGFSDDERGASDPALIPSIHDEDDSFEFAALADDGEASGDYEFALDDVSEPGPAHHSGTGVTQEVSLDQVEDMVLEAEMEELGFESDFPMNAEPEPSPLAPPAFDPAAARAFDAARARELEPEIDARRDVDSADAHTFDAEPIADYPPGPDPVAAPRPAYAYEPPTQADKPSFAATRTEPETFDQTVDSDFDAVGAAEPTGADFDRSTGADYDDAGAGTSLEDDLDEADFFISQGLYGEARDILETLLGVYPNHPLVMAKLQDVEAMDAAAGGSTETPAPELEVDDLVELNPQTLDTFAGAPENMTDADRPAVLLERPIEDEDADTHYDLGLAYKEMGLYGEAIKAFEKVLHNETRAVQCHLMIGLCHREQGNVSEGVHQFKQALHIQAITEREKHSVYYEIGVAYETLDDASEALYYFEMLHKKDPGYRDVTPRLAGLQARAGASETRRTGRAPDDADAALDSLLAESDFHSK